MAKKGLFGYIKPARNRGGKNQPRPDATGDDFFIDMGRDSAARFNPNISTKKK